MRKNGSAMLLLLFVQATLMVLSLAMIKTIYIYGTQANSDLYGRQAYYLAQSGIEIACKKLAENQHWFTDFPHYPEEDKEWLFGGAVGEIYDLTGSGSIKIVREQHKNILYSAGYIGDNNINYRKIVKIKFLFPFTVEARSLL
jgi:hypothetical protein